MTPTPSRRNIALAVVGGAAILTGIGAGITQALNTNAPRELPQLEPADAPTPTLDHITVAPSVPSSTVDPNPITTTTTPDTTSTPTVTSPTAPIATEATPTSTSGSVPDNTTATADTAPSSPTLTIPSPSVPVTVDDHGGARDRGDDNSRHGNGEDDAVSGDHGDGDHEDDDGRGRGRGRGGDDHDDGDRGGRDHLEDD